MYTGFIAPNKWTTWLQYAVEGGGELNSIVMHITGLPVALNTTDIHIGKKISTRVSFKLLFLYCLLFVATPILFITSELLVLYTRNATIRAL